MNDNVIRVHYEELGKIATQFQEEAALIQRMLTALENNVDVLRSGGWVSPAANQFYKDMEQDSCPGVTRLKQALDASSDLCHEIVNLAQNAEDEARACFK
jgi:WXG100 family type VII secretion target